MNEGLVFKVALIGVLGIGSQWLAWRFNLPAIVLMSVAGLLAGPVFGSFRRRSTSAPFSSR